MLAEDEIGDVISRMWSLHLTEMGGHDRVYDYLAGRRGIPAVEEGSPDELKTLARLSVLNVLTLVRDSFAQNLSVVGYRDATAEENDPAWAMWQRNRMDARQHEVYRPAISYGAAYVTVTPGPDGPVMRPRSPRQLLAVYDDPTIDAWPQYALETWVTQKDAKPHRKGVLYDEINMYTLDLGPVSTINPDGTQSASVPVHVVEVLDVQEHGGSYNGHPVCPVVRFINARDADDMVVGEIEPLIDMQRSINHVNFDRMIVARWGAEPQRVISGWTGTKGEVLAASAMRVWTFGNPQVKAQAFPQASLEPYNSVLDNMLAHVAMVAQISPSQVVGKMVNVSADALAAAEANQQRKLQAKRDSFGESWEQVMQLAAEMDGDEGTAADTSAEVLWRDTEARSFAAVVDGVTKLIAAEVPMEFVLPLVPGLTQQQLRGIKDAVDKREAEKAKLREQLPALPPPGAPTAAGEEPATGESAPNQGDDDQESGGE